MTTSGTGDETGDVAGVGTGAEVRAGDEVGDGELCGLGAAGGDEVLGKEEGADMTGGKYGLRRSIDTVHGFPDRKTIKVFASLCSTSKGPT